MDKKNNVLFAKLSTTGKVLAEAVFKLQTCKYIVCILLAIEEKRICFGNESFFNSDLGCTF